MILGANSHLTHLVLELTYVGRQDLQANFFSGALGHSVRKHLHVTYCQLA
jgi:hypothetical protein